jgi:hypothetical protein
VNIAKKQALHGVTSRSTNLKKKQIDGHSEGASLTGALVFVYTT